MCGSIVSRTGAPGPAGEVLFDADGLVARDHQDVGGRLAGEARFERGLQTGEANVVADAVRRAELLQPVGRDLTDVAEELACRCRRRATARLASAGRTRPAIGASCGRISAAVARVVGHGRDRHEEVRLDARRGERGVDRRGVGRGERLQQLLDVRQSGSDAIGLEPDRHHRLRTRQQAFRRPRRSTRGWAT